MAVESFRIQKPSASLTKFLPRKLRNIKKVAICALNLTLVFLNFSSRNCQKLLTTAARFTSHLLISMLMIVDKLPGLILDIRKQCSRLLRHLHSRCPTLISFDCQLGHQMRSFGFSDVGNDTIGHFVLTSCHQK